MPREIITINIGGTGVNVGQCVLEQFCVEQGISPNGDKECKTMYDDTICTLFEECSNGKYISRSLFLDLDPYSIETVRKRYKYTNVLHPDYLISGQEDAGNSFAKGHYTKGKELIDTVNDAIHTTVEACDTLQGFIINQSFSGGTGSGFGCLVLERIAVDYRRKPKIAFQVFPNHERLSSSMEVYNALFGIHWFLDHTELSVVIDNKAMDRICRNHLGITVPNYSKYNNVITKLISNVTANTRFALNEGLQSIYPGLVPFPRLHFVIPSMSPILSINQDDEKKEDEDIDYQDIQTLVTQSVSTPNFLVDIPNYSIFRDKYMSISFGFRGNDIDKCLSAADEAMIYLNDNQQINWVNWCSTKPSMKFCKGQTGKLPIDDIQIPNKQVTTIGNNTGIGSFFMDRVAIKTDTLYAKKAYVHHYVAEGMEEGEFAEAREDLGFLEMDYNEVLNNAATDDEEEDSDSY